MATATTPLLGLTTTTEDLSSSLPTNPLPPTTSSSPANSDPNSTIQYLAYGSNLCSETFLGKRGIKPLSSQAVHVPSLTLTFDLPGVPYIEPCFANTRYRLPNSPPVKSPYHKDRWQKGLIGVVYEVTAADYAIIIATEGGGSSYQDVLVDCYTLPSGASSLEAGLERDGKAFQAHTLLAERKKGKNGKDAGGLQRPDPSYAQPSARYLNLLTTGAEEHSLPEDYKEYLNGIRPYRITTVKQKMGRAILMLVWLPMMFLIMGISKLFADKNGKMPKWLAALMLMVFQGVWGTYDLLFWKVFGDGERTIGQDEDEEEGTEGTIRVKGARDLEKGCAFKRDGSGFWAKNTGPVVGDDSGVRI